MINDFFQNKGIVSLYPYIFDTMTIQDRLTASIQQAINELFQVSVDRIEFQATRKDFEGDVTVVIFPLLKVIKSSPVELGNKIGAYLIENIKEVVRFNVVSGFLNVVVSDYYYLDFFNEIKKDTQFGFVKPTEGAKSVMVEYSSPNTNKPLHLGHVRNNLLGYAVAEIIKASGKKVNKTQIINDRGIHICKSMLAWQKFGEGQTPLSTGLKGDKLVGNFYVLFEQKFQEEYSLWMEQETTDEVYEDLENVVASKEYKDFHSEENKKYTEKGFDLRSEDVKNEITTKAIKTVFKNNYFNKYSEIGLEVQEMLKKWEAGDEQVIALWKEMNQWVYDGFAQTYSRLGVDFDSVYYESDTYLLGKDVVEDGLVRGVFYKKEDGSVWIDLTAEGLDEKIVLRSDGTSVYMTQDIGTAIQRVKDYADVGGMVYTVGNEQDYHFKVLFLILEKLGFDWAKHLFHLSYGMVDLPSGKMKSREGTVVDADDLMQEMRDTAAKISQELGKLDVYNESEKDALYETIGLGALKYYILKVDPKKRILFNPEESVDFAGNTGPFIQYTYARIQSILRKATFDYSIEIDPTQFELHDKEKELIKQVLLYPEMIQLAAQQYSPAIIANYTYDLVKTYNSFYQSVSILGEEDMIKKTFRVQLSEKVAHTIKTAFGLLGINVPDRM